MIGSVVTLSQRPRRSWSTSSNSSFKANRSPYTSPIVAIVLVVVIRGDCEAMAVSSDCNVEIV